MGNLQGNALINLALACHTSPFLFVIWSCSVGVLPAQRIARLRWLVTSSRCNRSGLARSSRWFATPAIPGPRFRGSWSGACWTSCYRRTFSCCRGSASQQVSSSDAVKLGLEHEAIGWRRRRVRSLAVRPCRRP
eukprot:1021526-Pyramimonas_sp.AAC.1